MCVDESLKEAVRINNIHIVLCPWILPNNACLCGHNPYWILDVGEENIYALFASQCSSSSFVMMEEHEAKGLVLKDFYVKSSLALP